MRENKKIRGDRCPDLCRIVETPKGHYWCEDIVWQAINEECEKLGWR